MPRDAAFQNALDFEHACRRDAIPLRNGWTRDAKKRGQFRDTAGGAYRRLHAFIAIGGLAHARIGRVSLPALSSAYAREFLR